MYTEEFNKTEYTGGGVILLLNQGNDHYIVLTKRSEDAPVNPNSHSGFFGGAEIGEETKPKSIAARELNEEILVTTKDKKKVFYFHLDDQINDKDIKGIVEGSIELWNKKFPDKYKIVNSKLNPLKKAKEEEVEYIEHDGKKKIFISTFNFENSLEELIFFDCETKYEHPRDSLLDRQIDIFGLEEFNSWWLSNSSLGLKAAFSFKSGRLIPRGWVVRENKRISPSLILAFNQWFTAKEN